MQVKLHSTFLGDRNAVEAAGLVQSCVHCGFCNATCPTYQDRFDERDGPRGRIYLIRQLLQSGEAGKTTQLHLDRCLTCRACETTCPSGVRYGRLVDAGRELVERRVPRPTGQRMLRRLIRWVFPYPRRVAALVGLGRIVRPVMPRSLQRQIPIKQSTFHRPHSRAPAPRRMLVLDGCVQSAVTPHTNAAATRMLRRVGIELQSVARAGCCGAVDYHLGAHDAGLRFARRNIDAWWPLLEEGAEAIVTTASGCGVMVKDYGELLRHDPGYATKAARVSELAKDLSEVLTVDDVRRLQPVGKAGRTAVHCPCTLQHGQKLGSAVPRLLEAAGVPLAPTTEQHLCCGSAGTYSLLQADIGQRLLERKLAALTAGDPDVIVTANVGCQLHLGAQSGVPVRHWIEILDELFEAPDG